MSNYKKLVEKIYEEYSENDIIPISYIVAKHAAVYSTEIQNKSRIISELKKENIITALDDSNVILKKKNDFKIDSSSDIISIYKKIKKKFPLLNILVWGTEFLNDFMLHQIFSDIIIIEVESSAKDVVFAFLIEEYDKKYSVVTDEIFIKDSIPYFTKKRMIVKNIKNEYPKVRYNDMDNPKLEKILVDLYLDKIFLAYQGKELEYIYQNVFSKYDMNLKTLYRYARVRGKKDEVKEYIKNLDIDKRYKL